MWRLKVERADFARATQAYSRCHCNTESHCDTTGICCVRSSEGRKLISGIILFINSLCRTTHKGLSPNIVICDKGTSSNYRNSAVFGGFLSIFQVQIFSQIKVQAIVYKVDVRRRQCVLYMKALNQQSCDGIIQYFAKTLCLMLLSVVKITMASPSNDEQEAEFPE